MDLKTAYNYAVEHLNKEATEDAVYDYVHVLAVFQLGSRYAGYDIPSSDYDFTVVYMPSAKDLLTRENSRSKITFEHNDYEVEMSFMDIRKYLSRLLSSGLETLQMVYAPDKFCYYAQFEEDKLSLRAEELVDFMKDLREHRASFVYLSTDKLYDSILGRAKSSQGNMMACYENAEWGKVIKYGIGVEYLLDLLQAIYYDEEIQDGLQVSPVLASTYRAHRLHPSKDIAEVYAKRAMNLMEKASLNKQSLKEFLCEIALPEHLTQVVQGAWTAEFTEVILGGYAE